MIKDLATRQECLWHWARNWRDKEHGQEVYVATGRQQVRQMICDAQLRAVLVGREYRISLEALAEWLEGSG